MKTERKFRLSSKFGSRTGPQSPSFRPLAGGAFTPPTDNPGCAAWPARSRLLTTVASGRLRCRRRQRDGGLGCEHEKRYRLLKIEAHHTVRVAEIADRDVLPD